MREKFNAEFFSSFTMEESYIKKYLGEEIEAILNPEADSIHGVNLDSIYVSMPKYEAPLNPLKKRIGSDRCVFLTGLTGCGKSSLLNHVFNIKKKVHISNKSLYIPFSFDHAFAARSKNEIMQYYINTIKSACEVVLNELVKTGTKPSSSDLFEYIKKIRFDDLQYGDGVDNKTEEERLDLLLKNDPIEYYALRLKHYLFLFNHIDHVAVIVDDIESVGYETELVPIDIGLTFWSCLKRQPNLNPKTWSSCVVISCRHYIYRMIQKRAIDSKYTIKSGINSQTLESYPIDDEINISEPVKLVEIIRKRVDALSNLRDSKRWNETWTVVKRILVETDSTFGDFITALSINNIRKALTVLKKIVLNKRWIERDWRIVEETPGAFRIDSVDQYNLSPPCLLRAMALGEGNVYSDSSIIPNILKNTIDKNSDLVTLIVLRSFMLQRAEQAIDWRVSLDRFWIIDKLKEVLVQEELHPYIEDAVEFLIKNRLLLRSKVQAQDDGMDINEDNISTIEKVYVARSAYALWNQLGRSSVLLELLTDDIFIDFKSEKIERQSFLLFDSMAFERCLQFLTEMIERERILRYNAKNNGLSRKINSLIGSEFVTWQLRCGLVLSRNAYYKSSDEYKQRLDAMTSQIIKYQNLLAER